VDAGRFWAGVAATALVAALIGVVGVVIVDRILQVDLVVQDPLGTGSIGAAFVVGGVVAAVLAGGLLHLLVLTTPKPRAFFGWIMFLATLTAALLPLTWTDVLESSLASGAINALIGIAIWSLLLGVLSRTLRPGSLVD
jgi:non-ribosomal peptide synthetase component F